MSHTQYSMGPMLSTSAGPDCAAISRNTYKSFCADTEDSIFRNAGWLDAACADMDWYPIGAIEAGSVRAVLPVCVKRKYGVHIVTIPQNTQRFALSVKYPESIKTNNRKISFEHKVLQSLIDSLPKSAFIQLALDVGDISLLPFYWNGFTVEQRQTYVIPDLSDLDLVSANYDAEVRRQIRKGQDCLAVSDEMNAQEFFDFHVTALGRGGNQISYSLAHLQRLADFALSTNSGAFLCAKDSHGRVCAAIFVCWDSNSAYHLFQAADPNFRLCNPLPILVDAAIKKVSGKTKSYDFEGGMRRNIELSYRRYGSVAKKFFHIERHGSKVIKALLAFR